MLTDQTGCHCDRGCRKNFENQNGNIDKVILLQLEKLRKTTKSIIKSVIFFLYYSSVRGEPESIIQQIKHSFGRKVS